MAENMIKFLRGNVASLPQTATAGAVYFTKDEGLYLGLEDGSYHRYGDFITVANVASLPTTGAHETCMYYCESENVLAKWDGSEWVQINKQKTLEQLGGVAKSVYDAKMAALEKADTDNATAIDTLDKYVGTFTHATAKTVVEYINAKTDGIATSGNLEALGARVTTAEGDIDKLEASLAEGGATANAIAAAQKAGDDAQVTADSKTTMAEVEAKGYQTATQVQAIADGKDAAIEAAQDRADAAYALADGKATMTQVNEAIAGAGHAVKSEVEQAIADLETAYKKADGDLKIELEGKINVKADQTTVDGIDGRVATIEADYLKAADKYNDAKVKEDIAANLAAIGELQGEVDTLNGNAETAGSVDYKIAQAVAAIMENPDETMNSINELVTWIDGHAEDALELSNQVTTNKNDIATLNGLVGTTGVAAQIEAAITAALKVEGKDKYALVTELAAAIERIVALEEIDHEHSNKGVLDGITAEKVAAWDSAEANAEAHADGLNVAMDARVKVVEGKAHEHSNKALLDTYTQTEADLADAVAKKHAHTNATELAKIADGDVAKWNAAQANAEAYADGLASNYDAKGSASQALVDAKAYADGLAGNYDAVGSAAAAETAAKSYADGLASNYDTAGAASTAETNAKDYTDSALTWGSF